MRHAVLYFWYSLRVNRLWSIGLWVRLFSLLDMPFLIYFFVSKSLSMPVFSWFVEQLMRDETVKSCYLAKFIS
jgi:hypothetical protein